MVFPYNIRTHKLVSSSLNHALEQLFLMHTSQQQQPHLPSISTCHLVELFVLYAHYITNNDNDNDTNQMCYRETWLTASSSSSNASATIQTVRCDSGSMVYTRHPTQLATDRQKNNRRLLDSIDLVAENSSLERLGRLLSCYSTALLIYDGKETDKDEPRNEPFENALRLLESDRYNDAIRAFAKERNKHIGLRNLSEAAQYESSFLSVNTSSSSRH